MIENYPSNNMDNHHQNTSLYYLYLGILYISLVGLSYLLPASPGHKRKKIEACKKVDCDEYWFGLGIDIDKKVTCIFTVIEYYRLRITLRGRSVIRIFPIYT